MSTLPTRILIVDDSALYRQSIHNVLRDLPEASVVGTARNGVEALEKIQALDPDLLTLDVQMPDMDGIQVLNEIKRRGLRAKAIMVSGFTSQGAQVTTDALIEGAFDFILKPSSSNSDLNRQELKGSLALKIGAFRESLRGTSRRTTTPARTPPSESAETSTRPEQACEAIVLGASTGGPQALKSVLPKLPLSLPVPVLVAQHMPAGYTHSLARRLDEICELDVVEGRDALPVEKGMVIIAPGGKQMKLESQGSSLLVRINDDPAEHAVRPSVDYLLRSAVKMLDGNLLAVIMTGMGRDGTEGCREVKKAGGFVFAQSQNQCVLYGMPKSVIDQNLADRILPLGKIAPAMVRHVKQSRRSK